MHNATQFLINQQVRSYQASLQSWMMQVRASRDPVDAFRSASLKPSPGPLIRGLSSTTNFERMRAERQVEQALGNHLEKLSDNDPALLTIMRFAQGHWPLLYQKIEAKRRAGSTSPSDR